MPEQTHAQVIVSPSYKLGVTSPMSYTKVRRMRKDPTISLVRLMFFSGIIAAEWSVECDDPLYEDAVDFIHQNILPSRRLLLEKAALGCFDFGWQPFEKVIDIVDGAVKLKKLKPLLQDITKILTDYDELAEEGTGQFLGFRQSDRDLPLEKALLFNFDVEGTAWEGNSIMSNIEQPYDSQYALNDAAQRFDEKMAGAHWIVHYPVGNTPFNGKDTPNHEIADAILNSLKSSGSIAIPLGKGIMQDIDNESNGWKVELITAGGASFPFADRFNYLDKLKVRGAGFPERSILEGQFGTKAEAEAHSDFVITMIEYRHECIIETVNWHLVNQLLRLQFGADYENKVVIQQAPLNDVQRAMLKGIYNQILANPEGFMQESAVLDIEAIADALGIPRITDEELTNDELSKDLPTGGGTGTSPVPGETQA